MPNPNINLTLTAIASPVGNVTDPPVRGWYDPSCNGFWRDAALVVPSALLLLYLGFQAKRNLKKLNHRRSYVMIAYYALLWFTALFNLAWALLQVCFRAFLVSFFFGIGLTVSDFEFSLKC